MFSWCYQILAWNFRWIRGKKVVEPSRFMYFSKASNRKMYLVTFFLLERSIKWWNTCKVVLVIYIRNCSMLNDKLTNIASLHVLICKDAMKISLPEHIARDSGMGKNTELCVFYQNRWWQTEWLEPKSSTKRCAELKVVQLFCHKNW